MAAALHLMRVAKGSGSRGRNEANRHAKSETPGVTAVTLSVLPKTNPKNLLVLSSDPASPASSGRLGSRGGGVACVCGLCMYVRHRRAVAGHTKVLPGCYSKLMYPESDLMTFDKADDAK